MAKRIPNDEPTLNDLAAVGCSGLVERVGKAIVGAVPPQVFGVHAEWGAGKTSFLHQLQYYLTGVCPQKPGETPAALRTGAWNELVTVVWFEAWRYQHEDVPIVALLHEIRTQLPWASKLLEKSSKLLEVGIRGALLSLEDLTKKIGFQASKIEQAGREWENQNFATQLPSHLVRNQLDHAIKALIGEKDQHRLVVLIDDLDRCDPQCAYRLLEGIKIYLNLPSCVFVLAMNQRIVEEAVAKHLPGTDGQNPLVRQRRAKEYLEKLCTSVYHLPLVREPGKLLAEYLDTDPMWGELCSVVEEFKCLPRVPRKIKGYASLLLRFEDRLSDARKASQKANQGELDRWAKIAVIFTYLYHFEHEVYRHLWAEPDFYQQELVAWAKRRVDENYGGPLRIFSSRLVAKDGPKGDSPLPEDGTLTPLLLDPAAADVLHIQDLIASLDGITSDEWKANLLV